MVLNNLFVPTIGWIKAIRNGIGMIIAQLGKNLSMSKQGLMDMQFN